MIEIADAKPEVQVAEAEFLRLLGYPPGHHLEGRSSELAAWAREWYMQNGHPWIYARETAALELTNSGLRIEGAAFHSERLREAFRETAAQGAILAAVSAGPETEREAQRLWEDEKPDEYFFLETFASAAAEHLIMLLRARLCDWAERQGGAILPHYSPGYTGWDVAEQPRLLALANGKLPGPLETLESGALRPKKSLLAVFGVTANSASIVQLTAGPPCRNCAFTPCQFRRAPGSRGEFDPRKDGYTVNSKALGRWAAQRLRLRHCEDGLIEARFRYDGTTCSNMGRPLAFDYTVMLGPKEEGFPLRGQRCAPAPGDSGHRAMCQYIADRESLMAAIEREKPLLGKPIGGVLEWRRQASPEGCYCNAASRDHKWGLVLETIHYALRQNGDL